MKAKYSLAIGALIAFIPGDGFSQTQAAAAQSGPFPPFCFECQQAWFGEGCFAPICNAVERGWTNCQSGFTSCSDNFCYTFGLNNCVFDPFALGVDGSIRAPELTGLSRQAVAALLGLDSADDAVLRRPCDQAVVGRRVDAISGFEKRRRTRVIVV